MAKTEIEKMDEDKFIKYIEDMTNEAIDYQDQKLGDKWKNSQRYYFGEKLGNEEDGKSQVISRDLSDSVDWMMPALMEIFGSGKRAVMYQPNEGASQVIAEQRTDYANYVFFTQNRGFDVMHDWFKDALLFNNGVVKHYWEEQVSVQTEAYEGLDEVELVLVLSQPNVEVIERTDREDGLVDVRVTVTKDTSQIKVENIKPEDFLIDEKATCAKDAKFVGERKRVTISELREAGYSEELICDVQRNNYEDDTDLSFVRDQYNGSVNTHNNGHQNGGEANQLVMLVEAYVKIDFDGDGIAELRRVVFSNGTILENDAWDMIPYSTITPNPIQHKFYGQSIFDATKDIQDIKTVILRNQLDNMYLTNNGRYAVVEGQVNLADLQNNKTGGVVREKMQGALRPLDQPPLPQGAYDMLGYMDEKMTNRTGVSSRSQGLDDKVLNSHTGQGQVNKVMSVAEQRQKLVARIFAETGVKDLFHALYQLITRNQRKAQTFYKEGKWITVDPSTWEDDTVVKVVTGLGANNDDQKLAYLMRMFEMTQAIVNQGGLDVLTNEEKIYNILKEMTECVGYKDTDRFWIDPTTPEGMEAVKAKREAMSKPSPEQIKAEADMRKQESDAQIKMLEAKSDMEKAKAEQEIKLQELALEERALALKEREQALQEDIQDLENRKFEWSKQLNISEVILEKESQRAVSIGDNKIFKGRNKGQSDSGNTGG